jgi:hypothetical protein
MRDDGWWWTDASLNKARIQRALISEMASALFTRWGRRLKPG